MGGRFTSNDAAMAPFMRELSNRGLLFVDDGELTRAVIAFEVTTGR